MTEQQKYIENVGLFYAKYGLPKMAGRILGYLIASETSNNSFQNLQGDLKASKGSISGNLNLLLSHNMIEKHMVTGDRKSYFKLKTNNLEQILAAKLKSISAFKAIWEQGNLLKKDKQSSNYKTVEELIKYYNFLEQEIPLLNDKWNKLNCK